MSASVFQDLFLQSAEKDRLAQWYWPVRDHSLVNRALSPLLNRLVGFVPEGVGPSLLTLCGSAALLQAWYLIANGAGPVLLLHTAAILSVSIFYVLGALDVRTADRSGDTPVAELFRYMCGLVGAPFIMSMACLLVGPQGCHEVQWYLVQAVQLTLFLRHYFAFKREAALYHCLIGPGELLGGMIALLASNAIFGQTVVKNAFGSILGGFLSPLAQYRAAVPEFLRPGLGDDDVSALAIARMGCLLVFASTLCVLALSGRSRPHWWTRAGLAAALLLRAGATVVRLVASGRVAGTANDAIYDGLFLAMLTTDIIVGKMAGRGMHPWMVPMALMAFLPQGQSLAVVFVGFYIIATFCDLVMHTNLPLFQAIVNVYCDGIYDLCHMGHKNAFQSALKHGNRLFVGVVGDKDAQNYKRPPIMSAAEREREVSKCKSVTKVIQNAPCFGLTEDFISEQRIHVVCFGREYLERFPNPDDDPYYKVPRKMGIAVPLDRYDEMSTTDIIHRVLTRGSDSKKSPT